MKKIIKSLIPKSIRKRIRIIINDYNKEHKNASKKEKIIYLVKNYTRYKFYDDDNKMLKNIDIFIGNHYVYGIDKYKKMKFTNFVIENNSIDYKKVLEYSLDDFYNKLKILI